MRLDKYLAQMSVRTRSEVKKSIKSGRVFVNGIPAARPEQKVMPGDLVTVDGQPVEYAEFEYYMLNKPKGYVSATRDNTAPHVLSLIQSGRDGLFPVGRLDKDTEGLLLITDDGELAHRLLSPKKHVWKTYLVQAQGILDRESLVRLEQGVDIGDDRETMPARAVIQRQDQGFTWLELSIQEGRYHQVKRMLQAVGHPTAYLKRLSMGSLRLDESLEPGAYRRLTDEEAAVLGVGIRNC